jgi:glycosyltransferase involved in cell wall biosynthesis
MLPVKLYSAKTLQHWDPDTPFTTGIGGSETAHIEMHKCLEDLNIDVESYAPIVEVPASEWGDTGQHWPGWNESETLRTDTPALIINYRSFELYDKEFSPGTKHWFIAQDVDYPWTEERLAKIDRYITLCTDHSKYTLAKYPKLKGKVFQSSNGVRKEYIEKIWQNAPRRDSQQLIYASSPDRGLLFLLKHFWRIRERCPEVILKVAYGFENTNKIIELMGGKSAYHEGFRDEVIKLLHQPGVKFLGRLSQDKLYEEWFKSNVWTYPCNFAETSCITCMDAQACGAVPVTNNLWALRDNVNDKYGCVLPGQPQDDVLLRSYFIEEVIENLKNPMKTEKRKKMADAALKKFDWKNIAKQWKNWILEDTKNV